MQNCFREYPDVYGSELDSDADDEDDMSSPTQPQSSTSEETRTRSSPASTPSPDTYSSNTQSQSSQTSQPRDNDHAASAKGKFSGEPNSKPHGPSHEDALVPQGHKPVAGQTSSRNPIYDARGDMSSTEEMQEQEKKRSKEEVKGNSDTERANAAKKQVKSQQPVSESERMVPKAAHDEKDKVTERRPGDGFKQGDGFKEGMQWK
jgi:intermembrane space import and assembly protein 40